MYLDLHCDFIEFDEVNSIVPQLYICKVIHICFLFRCSIGQLKSLATTLEPVFHRDFVNALKDLYPSASLRKIKKRMRAKRGRGKGSKGKYRRKQMSRLISNSGSLSRQQSRSWSRSTINEEIDFEINDWFSRETTMEYEEEERTEDAMTKHNNRNNIETVEQFVHTFVNDVFGDALRSLDLKIDPQNKENLEGENSLLVDQRNDFLNKYPSVSDVGLTGKMGNSTRNKFKDIPSVAKLEKFLGDLRVEPNQLQNTGILLKHHHNTVGGHRLDSRAKSSDFKVIVTRSLEGTRSALIHQRHNSVVATPEMKHREFFQTRNQAKLGKCKH